MEPICAAVIAGAWGAPGFAMEVCVRWLADGTVAALEDAKRRDAIVRQSIAREALAKMDVRANPSAYHLLIDLPLRLRAAEFIEAAAKRGIAITPGSAFAVSPAHAPNAIRIALANLDIRDVGPVLSSIAKMAGLGC